MKRTTFRYPKTKTGEKTFRRIIRHGKRLFAKHGYHSTSVNDIIAKSRIASGTFYIYFDSKLALYLYLLDEYKHKIRQASTEATNDLDTRYEMEREGLKAFIMYAKKDPLSYKLIWESMFVNPDIFKEYYTSFGESYTRHLFPFVETGEVREDIDLKNLSFMLMGIANFVGLEILFMDKTEESDIDHVVDETMKVLKNGMFRNKEE